MLAPPSHSPWTPGEMARRPCRRRGRVHQLKEEIPGGEQSFWPRSIFLHLRENLLLWKQLLKRRLNLKRRMFSSVTNVRTTSNLKTAWRSTLAKLTRKWTPSLQHLNIHDNSRGVQWASPPPPSWTPAGRSPHQYHLSLQKNVDNVFPILHCPYVPNISASNVVLQQIIFSKFIAISPYRWTHNCDLKANYGPGSQLSACFFKCNNCSSLLPCHNNKILLLLLLVLAKDPLRTHGK